MILMVAFLLFCIIVLGVTIGPKVYNYCIKSKKEEEREKFLQRMELKGSLSERSRVKEIRDIDNAIVFKLIECEQAIKVLENPHVRSRLEEANVDVEELKKLLKTSSEDEVLMEFRQLEKELDEVKLLKSRGKYED